MLKQLQEFGLSENEAKVYFAALEMGKATADQLAKQANVKRPTTYVQLETLIKKGLMSTYEDGKKTYFAPESPEQLRRVLSARRHELEQQEQELDRILPDLSRMLESAGERPVVRFFDGKEGIVAAREEVLGTKRRNILVIYPHDSLAGAFSFDERNRYTEQRIKKGITARMIYNSKEGSFDKSRPLSEQRHVAEDELMIQNDIVIWDDVVTVTSLKGKMFAFSVQSKTFAESLRSLFEFAWKNIEKKNKKGRAGSKTRRDP